MEESAKIMPALKFTLLILAYEIVPDKELKNMMEREREVIFSEVASG